LLRKLLKQKLNFRKIFNGNERLASGAKTMRLSAVIAGLGVCLMAGVQAGAQESSSRMLTFGNQDRAAGVTILRGSAIAPKAAEPAPAMVAERWQVSSGERLWLTDPATGEVMVCRQARTTQVGERVIRCVAGDMPRRVLD
jgi:hypothetical protein